jgi:hypothetical protein
MTELGVVSHNRALPLRDGRRPAHSLCGGTDSRRSAKGVNPILGSHWNGGFGSRSVLPEANRIGAVSAELRRPRPRTAMSG